MGTCSRNVDGFDVLDGSQPVRPARVMSLEVGRSGVTAMWLYDGGGKGTPGGLNV